MGFSMRMNLSGQIIKKDSFKTMYINGQRNGFEFDVQMGYYRGHYLSAIDVLEIYVDDEKMPAEAVTFELRGKELPLYRLKLAATEFWSQVELAKLRVILPGGLPVGDHKIRLNLMLRIPYMAIGEGHTYMPLDSGDTVTVTVSD